MTVVEGGSKGHWQTGRSRVLCREAHSGHRRPREWRSAPQAGVAALGNFSRMWDFMSTQEESWRNFVQEPGGRVPILKGPAWPQHKAGWKVRWEVEGTEGVGWQAAKCRVVRVSLGHGGWARMIQCPALEPLLETCIYCVTLGELSLRPTLWPGCTGLENSAPRGASLQTPCQLSTACRAPGPRWRLLPSQAGFPVSY